MIRFINRDAEMTLIDDAFKALHNYEEELLRTPIVNFYGVEGIGKTAILRHVERKCQEQNLRYILIETIKDAQDLSHELFRQAKKYNVSLSFAEEENDVSLQSIEATKALLSQGTIVILLDAVDTTNEELVAQLAGTLRGVIEDDNKLFVILTSRKCLIFENDRLVSRRLTSLQLKPFDQKGCQDYLDSIGTPLDREIREQIYDWTRGYPLAMEVMTGAIIERHLDPRREEDQRALVDLIEERVIDQGVLASLQTPRLEAYKAALMLLCIPRRFNLAIMQELIENFESDLKQQSGLSYMSLPRTLNQNTDILSWNMLKAGYSLDASVRNVFILKNRIENPERFLAIHRFLADLNKRLADGVPGSDRIRYLREYLYHSAITSTAQEIEQIARQTVELIANELTAFFEQFHEEFLQDEELKDALGEQRVLVESLLNRYRARIHRAAAASEVDRLIHLREFFYYLVNDPLMNGPQGGDLDATLTLAIQELLKEGAIEDIRDILIALSRDDVLQQSLGTHFPLFSSRIQEILAEG
jgi:hypothetical protein